MMHSTFSPEHVVLCGHAIRSDVDTGIRRVRSQKQIKSCFFTRNSAIFGFVILVKIELLVDFEGETQFPLLITLSIKINSSIMISPSSKSTRQNSVIILNADIIQEEIGTRCLVYCAAA